MIVFKIFILFLPLLLVNAQGGRRFGIPGRSDFRRPILRPWQRPSVSPAPDTPMPTEKMLPTEKIIPTEKVVERVTDSPRARSALSSISPIVAPRPQMPLSRLPPRGRFWPQPAFGPKPESVVPISPIETTTKALEIVTPIKETVFPVYSPDVLSTTQSYLPSTRSPFVPNHVTSNSHQNFDDKAQYSPYAELTEKVHSEIKKTTTELPSTTQEAIKVTEHSVNDLVVSVPSKAAESKAETFPTTSKASLIEENIKPDNPSSSKPDDHIKPYVSESTPASIVSSTPKLIIVPAVTTTSSALLNEQKNNPFSNFNTRNLVPPYTSHTLNVPITANRPDFTFGSQFPSSENKQTAKAIEQAPSTSERKPYHTQEPSTNEPFIKIAEAPSKIVSTTEISPARTNVYKLSTQGINSFKENYYEPTTSATKDISASTKEPEVYTIPITTKVPLIVDQKKDDGEGFTSKTPAIWAIETAKTTKTPTDNYKFDVPSRPEYSNNHRASYEELQSLTNAPTFMTNPTPKAEEYTAPTTFKSLLADDYKNDDFTSQPPMEFTSQHQISTESSFNSDTYSAVRSIYNADNEEEYYKENGKPEIVKKNNSTQSYKTWFHQGGPATVPVVIPKAIIIQPSNNNRYNKLTVQQTKPTTPKPSLRYTTALSKNSYVAKVYDIGNFKCKDDGFYPIVNQCDDFIECKSGVPIQNSCPDGLHFNPAARHSEFPCAYPSEVKCESQAESREAQPTSECPRRYGYFSMPSGGCDKYIMCQEGLATVMSCPAGLAFSVATSSCDWPSNVPDCVPDVFEGFVCPAPELDEDGNPTHSIYKYRYKRSCKKYIACQKGHPRLLSCDYGLSFDENYESCVDENRVLDCT